MRNVWRNLQNLAGSDDLLYTCQDKAQGAVLDHRDLFVMMAVLGHRASFSNIKSRHRHCFSMNHLAHEQWIHLLFLDLIPFIKLHGGPDCITHGAPVVMMEILIQSGTEESE